MLSIFLSHLSICVWESNRMTPNYTVYINDKLINVFNGYGSVRFVGQWSSSSTQKFSDKLHSDTFKYVVRFKSTQFTIIIYRSSFINQKSHTNKHSTYTWHKYHSVYDVQPFLHSTDGRSVLKIVLIVFNWPGRRSSRSISFSLIIASVSGCH